MVKVSLFSWSGISDSRFIPSRISGRISLQRSGCPPHPGRCIFDSQDFNFNLTHKWLFCLLYSSKAHIMKMTLSQKPHSMKLRELIAFSNNYREILFFFLFKRQNIISARFLLRFGRKIKRNLLVTLRFQARLCYGKVLLTLFNTLNFWEPESHQKSCN